MWLQFGFSRGETHRSKVTTNKTPQNLTHQEECHRWADKIFPSGPMKKNPLVIKQSDCLSRVIYRKIYKLTPESFSSIAQHYNTYCGRIAL